MTSSSPKIIVHGHPAAPRSLPCPPTRRRQGPELWEAEAPSMHTHHLSHSHGHTYLHTMHNADCYAHIHAHSHGHVRMYMENKGCFPQVSLVNSLSMCFTKWANCGSLNVFLAIVCVFMGQFTQRQFSSLLIKTSAL